MRPVLSLVLMAILLTLPHPASAALDRTKIAAAEKAANDFTRLARDSFKSGKPPRESDPAVKSLLDVAFDTAVAPPANVEFSDLPRINQWMAIGDRIGLVYMLAGTGTNNLGQAATNPKTSKLIPQNIAAFQTEYGRFTDFQIALWSLGLDAIVAKIDSASEAERKNPKFLGGYVQISNSIAQTIAGVIATFPTQGITNDWRRARLGPLNEIAPKAQKALPMPIRQKLRELALEVSEKTENPEIKESVKALGDNLAK